MFGADSYFIAGASGGGMNTKIAKEPGGYRISGTWRYCSGSTHGTYFLGAIDIPTEVSGSEPFAGWFAIPRADYVILDDWGGTNPQMGLRGSGSNSTMVDDVFVPEHMMVDFGSWAESNSGPSIGSELHDDPTYAGAFLGVAEGEVFAMAVGLGYAAIDEYERILRTSKVPRSPLGQLRGEHPDFQRALGLGLGWVDSAAAILRRCGELYEEYCALSVAGVEPFDRGKATRLVGMNYTGEKLVYDTVQEFIHSAGSTAMLNGARLQRYFRDIVQLHTRTDQFRFTAPTIATEYLGEGFETDWSKSSLG
jgi:3-hydroxy-9,10-secoandrosta-1,3,5(10)-triene-9,17-dione monooxygenase